MRSSPSTRASPRPGGCESPLPPRDSAGQGRPARPPQRARSADEVTPLGRNSGRTVAPAVAGRRTRCGRSTSPIGRRHGARSCKRAAILTPKRGHWDCARRRPGSLLLVIPFDTEPVGAAGDARGCSNQPALPARGRACGRSHQQYLASARSATMVGTVNDPHVAALVFALGHGPSVAYCDDMPPITHEEAAFRLVLENGVNNQDL